eukprot:COSAG02_NODE_23098_length_730_cov_1.096672_2_plen_78_part_01
MLRPALRVTIGARCLLQMIRVGVIRYPLRAARQFFLGANNESKIWCSLFPEPCYWLRSFAYILAVAYGFSTALTTSLA